MQDFQIILSEANDLDFVCQLFEEAIAYQKRKGYPEYRTDDRANVKQLIQNQQHYKIIIEGEIASVFNMAYADPDTWREKEMGNALYLQRALINPKFKGQKLFGRILEWAILFCSQENRQFIRMDTWDHNPDLISYYTSFGFRVVEHFTVPPCQVEVSNCSGNQVVLLEYAITS